MYGKLFCLVFFRVWDWFFLVDVCSRIRRSRKFVRSFFCSFVSFISSFQSVFILFIYSFNHSFVRLFHSFIHSFIFSFNSFVHSFIHSFNSFIHSTCNGNVWDCTSNECEGSCSIYGDPHYTTFDGKRFLFEGKCKYTVAEDQCGSQNTGLFSLVAENVLCGSTGKRIRFHLKQFFYIYKG